MPYACSLDRSAAGIEDAERIERAFHRVCHRAGGTERSPRIDTMLDGERRIPHCHMAHQIRSCAELLDHRRLALDIARGLLMQSASFTTIDDLAEIVAR